MQNAAGRNKTCIRAAFPAGLTARMWRTVPTLAAMWRRLSINGNLEFQS